MIAQSLTVNELDEVLPGPISVGVTPHTIPMTANTRRLGRAQNEQLGELLADFIPPCIWRPSSSHRSRESFRCLVKQRDFRAPEVFSTREQDRPPVLRERIMEE